MPPPRSQSRGRLPRWAVLALLPALFLASLSLVVGLCAQLLPALASDGAGQLPLPLSLSAIHQSTHTILQAAERHPLLVASTYASIYIFVQSWGVPGAFLLNALGGALFGTVWGTLFNDILCVTGASFKYLMSREFGTRLFASAACSCVRFEERIRPLRLSVDAARKQHTLFFFLISLRVFPGMPHWALNLAAPHAGVPLLHFIASTLVGMLPYIAVTVRAGAMLSALPPNATAADVLSWPVLGGMAALAAAVLALALLLARYQHQLVGGGRAGGSSGGASDRSLARGVGGSPPRSAGPSAVGGTAAPPSFAASSSTASSQSPGLKAAHGKGAAAFLGSGVASGIVDVVVQLGGSSL